MMKLLLFSVLFALKIEIALMKGVIVKIYSRAVVITVFDSSPELVELPYEFVALSGHEELITPYNLLENSNTTEALNYVCQLVAETIASREWSVVNDVISVTILLHKALFHNGYYTLSDHLVENFFRNFYNRADNILYHQKRFDEIDSAVWKYLWFNYNKRNRKLKDDAVITRDPYAGIILLFPVKTPPKSLKEGRIVKVKYLNKEYSIFGWALTSLSIDTLLTNGVEILFKSWTEKNNPCFQLSLTIFVDKRVVPEVFPLESENNGSIREPKIAFNGSDQVQQCSKLLLSEAKLSDLVRDYMFYVTEFIYNSRLNIPHNLNLVTSNEDYFKECNAYDQFTVVENNQEKQLWNCSTLLKAYDRAIAKLVQDFVDLRMNSDYVDLAYNNLGSLLTENPIYLTNNIGLELETPKETPDDLTSPVTSKEAELYQSQHYTKGVIAGVTVATALVVVMVACGGIMMRRRLRRMGSRIDMN